MKLFFKHLGRSIVKKPLQPVILIVTLMLAIIVSIFSFSLRDSMEEEIARGQELKYGASQITIGLNANADSRFMFADEAEKVLGGDGVAAGTFELPLMVGQDQKTVFGVAVDFDEIGKIFDFTFTEYGEVTPSMVGHSAFVTQAFAKENSLRLGDTFTVTAFGEKKTYTVSGISKVAFIDDYKVMVDISGVIRLITDESPLLSALGDSFKPCTTIYVGLVGENSGEAITSAIARIQADEHFADKSVSDVSRAMRSALDFGSLGYIIDAVSVLAVLLSACVTFCCFYIIASERTEENYAFTLSGAKPWMLNFLQYAEIFLYWVVSTILASLFVSPITKGLFSLAGFRYASSSIRPLQLVLGAGILLVVSLATVTLFIGIQKLRRRNKTETQSENGLALCLLGIVSVLAIFAFVAPMDIRFFLFIVFLISISLCLFVVMPVLIKWIAKRMNDSAERRLLDNYTVKRIPLRYAVKNIYSVKLLHNISRLVAVLTSIVMVSCLMIGAAFGFVENTETFFGADYVLMNATESCLEKVSQCENVHGAVRIFWDDSNGTRMVSAESAAAFSENISITKMPKGNQAVLASGKASYSSLKIGDTFTQTLNGEQLELVVIDIVESGTAFVLFDCEYFEIPYNMMTVKGAEGVSKSEFLQELTDVTALELAVVMPLADLFEEKFAVTYICLNIGAIFLTVVAIFAGVGIADNLYESYRSRKEEFDLYAYSGMSGKEIQRMKKWEVGLTFAFGIALGIIGFVVMAFVSNACLKGVGFETFINALTFLQ